MYHVLNLPSNIMDYIYALLIGQKILIHKYYNNYILYTVKMINKDYYHINSIIYVAPIYNF